MITIWMTVDNFKKIQVQFIPHPETRTSLQSTLLKERKVGIGFAIVNLLI